MSDYQRVSQYLPLLKSKVADNQHVSQRSTRSMSKNGTLEHLYRPEKSLHLQSFRIECF
jgi:hypothetical protein